MAKKTITLKNFKYDPSIDYQSEYELLPIEIKELALSEDYVTEEYDTSADLSAKLLKEVEKKGWTFDYNFMGEIYSLRPIGEPEQEFSKGNTYAEGGEIGKAIGGIENVDDIFVEGKYPNGDEFSENQYTNDADYVVNDWLKNSRGLESYTIFARMNDGEEIEIQEFRNGGYYAEGGEMPKGWSIKNGIKPSDNDGGYDRVHEVWKYGKIERVFDNKKEAMEYVAKQSSSTYAEGGGVKQYAYYVIQTDEEGNEIGRRTHPIILDSKEFDNLHWSERYERGNNKYKKWVELTSSQLAEGEEVRIDNTYAEGGKISSKANGGWGIDLNW